MLIWHQVTPYDDGHNPRRKPPPPTATVTTDSSAGTSGGRQMTIYHRVGREVEVVGADVSGDEGWTVWWAYAGAEFDDGLEDRHRGIERDPIGQLRADGGTEEIFGAIDELPDNRVRGKVVEAN